MNCLPIFSLSSLGADISRSRMLGGVVICERSRVETRNVVHAMDLQLNRGSQFGGEPAVNEIVTYVTQSKFFSPAFNAAIFDGPIRIYFAQYQESQALKLYHNLQERFSEVRRQARGIFKSKGQNIFVMLYPTTESFDLSFSDNAETIGRDRLGVDYVLGVRGPLEDDIFDCLCLEMDTIVNRYVHV